MSDLCENCKSYHPPGGPKCEWSFLLYRWLTCRVMGWHSPIPPWTVDPVPEGYPCQCWKCDRVCIMGADGTWKEGPNDR